VAAVKDIPVAKPMAGMVSSHGPPQWRFFGGWGLGCWREGLRSLQPQQTPPGHLSAVFEEPQKMSWV
jgi:hypothetical protein